MKRKKPIQRRNRDSEVSSYEASLTPEELEQFHERVCSGQPVGKIIAACIPWRDGKFKGKKPTKYTINRVKARLNLDDILQEIEGTTQFIEATTAELDALVRGTEAEKVLDQVIALIGQEVIHRTLKRLNPEARTAAARLLLKRADQRRVDRRLGIIENELKKDAPTGNQDIGLTPEEKRERMKEILRIN